MVAGRRRDAVGLQRTTVSAKPQPRCGAAQNGESISSLILSAKRTAQGHLQCLAEEADVFLTGVKNSIFFRRRMKLISDPAYCMGPWSNFDFLKPSKIRKLCPLLQVTPDE